MGIKEKTGYYYNALNLKSPRTRTGIFMALRGLLFYALFAIPVLVSVPVFTQKPSQSTNLLIVGQSIIYSLIGLLLLAVAFIVVDGFIRFLIRRQYRAMLSRVLFDFIAVGLGLLMITIAVYMPLKVIPGFPQIPSYDLAVILVVFILTIGVIVLDAGLATGLWLVASLLAVPIASGSALSSSSSAPILSPFIMSIIALVGTLPIVASTFYFKSSGDSSRKITIRLAIIWLVIAHGVVFALPTIWIGVLENQRYTNMVELQQNKHSLITIRQELEREFSVSDIRKVNPKLASSLVRLSTLTSNNLYIFDSSQKDTTKETAFSLIVGARYGTRIMIIRNISRIPQTERVTIISNLLKKNKNPASYQEELAINGTAMSGLFAARNLAKSQNRLTIARTQNTGLSFTESGNRKLDSGLALVMTPVEPAWWIQQSSGLSNLLYSQAFPELLPWYFFIFFFLSSAALFVVFKRSEFNQKNVQAEERARISQDAHDRISNRLSALALQAELAGEVVSEQHQFLSQLPDILRRAVADLKNIITTDQYGSVPKESLKTQLKDICRAREKDYPFALTYDVNLPDDVTPDVRRERAILSCFEEALGNIAKHANAKKVTVKALWKTVGYNRLCCLTIEDDGLGFEPPDNLDSLLDEGCRGLAGISRRIGELGGEFTIVSRPGKGSKLEITWGC